MFTMFTELSGQIKSSAHAGRACCPNIVPVAEWDPASSAEPVGA